MWKDRRARRRVFGPSDLWLLVFFLLSMFSCLNLRRTSPIGHSSSNSAVVPGCPFCHATKENGFDIVYEVRINYSVQFLCWKPSRYRTIASWCLMTLNPLLYIICSWYRENISVGTPYAVLIATSHVLKLVVKESVRSLGKTDVEMGEWFWY